MIKILHIALVAIVLSGASMLYHLKYKATADVAMISKLKTDIAKEKDLIGRLEAEWAYLNRPENLSMLVEKHLAMKPLALNQIGLRDIRERPYPLPDPLTRMLDALERADKDVVTAKLKPKTTAKPVKKQAIAKQVVTKKPQLVKKPTPRYAKPRDITDIIAGLAPKPVAKRAKP